MRRFVLRALNAIFPSRAEPDLARELASHLALLEDEYRRRGLTPDEARRAARLALGGVEQTKELHRNARSLVWIDDLRRDLAYAARTLRRAPGFTLAATVTLALAIGANTAMFSITHAVLLRPLPYRQPDRLVAVWDRIVRERGISKLFVQYRDLERWQADSRTFEELAAVTWATSNRMLTGHGAARNVLAIPATVNLFSLLGAAPRLGRTFQHDDLARGCTLVLSHRFWQEALGSPATLSDLSLALDGEACIAVGVMPPGFAFYPEATAMWRLITPNDALVRNSEHTGGVGVFGRLRRGVSPATAEAELTLLSSRLDRGLRYGVEMEPRVYPLQQEFTWLAGRNLRLSLIVLFAAVAFVLLIACVNVANLLLGRSLTRSRELAIRAALGSGRGRLVRQLLTESLMLATAAAALGDLLAWAAVAQFRRLNPIELPPGVTVDINLVVLAFTTALAVVTTVLFGLLPALRASHVDFVAALKSGGRVGHDRRRYRLANALIIGEMSLSLVLLVGAGLLIESVVRFASTPLGFEPAGLVAMTLHLPPQQYGSEAARAAFFDRVMARLSGAAGVQNLALSTVLPLRRSRGSQILAVDGRPEPTPGTAVHDISTQSVTPGYFTVMNIERLQGRGFNAGDRAAAPRVAIVNETLAREYFDGEDPIGRRIRFFDQPETSNPWLTIVGIMADEKRSTVYSEMAWADVPVVYQPLMQKPAAGEVSALVRTNTAAPGIGAALARQIAAIDPGVVVGDIETAQRLIDRYVAYPRFRAVLLGSFAAVALVLAVVGLYAVLSQLVAHRTAEIGLRMALGAQRTEVVALIVRQGMRLAVAGVAAGAVAAAWLARFLGSLLFEVRADDPITFAAVALLLLTAALLAACVPARRAAAVDPMIALRAQ